MRAATMSPSRTDRPSSSHEFLGGFWVVEAEDDEAAEALAIEGAQACGNAVEIRRLQGT
jgi:hypothetical protein